MALVGYHMLQGESSSVHTPTDEDNEKSRQSILDIAITPLAIPILAGPGTIATAMNYTAEGSFQEILWVLGALAIMCVVTFFAFIAGPWLMRVLGQNFIKVITRLMGLILLVIGVQMLIIGVQGVN